jgi:4-amino-4-deoxy-L-arabinose transferase-like glycosyltransferase
MPTAIWKKILGTILLCVLLVALILRLQQQSIIPLYDWDESIYAQVAYEISQNDSLLLSYNGNPWLEKPPLYLGLLALIFEFAGRNEVLLRGINIGFAILLTVLLYFLNRKILATLYEKELKTVPALAQMLFYSLPAFFLFASPAFTSRTVTVNVDLILATGWIGFFLFSGRWLLQVVFLLFGVLSKSLFGFYSLAIYALIQLPKLSFRTFGYLAGLAVIGMAWYLIMLAIYGSQFVQIHFVDHLFRRFSDPIELKFGGRLYYAIGLWNDYGPVLLAILASYGFLLVELLRDIKKHSRSFFTSSRWEAYCILFAPLLFLALLTMSKTKIIWYLIPLYPLLALAPAAALGSLLRYQKKAVAGVAAIMALGLSVLFYRNTILYTAFPDNTTRVQLAECMEQVPGDSVAFFVDEQERKNMVAMKSANINISTSFDYGGTPRFIYYSKKKVDFFYTFESFEQAADKYPLAVITAEDYLKLKTVDQFGSSRIKECEFDNWQGYRLK